MKTIRIKVDSKDSKKLLEVLGQTIEKQSFECNPIKIEGGESVIELTTSRKLWKK